MARAPRIELGNTLYHTLNRINARIAVFTSDEDYLLFRNILFEVAARLQMRVLAYCIMPNHWHLLVYPRNDGDLSEFMKLLSIIHTQRHHVLRRTIGTGHIYQGRYKSYVVDTNEHVLQACRYIERNPLRAGLVVRAEDWKWSSLQERISLTKTPYILSELPVDLPKDYLAWVNEPESSEATKRLRKIMCPEPKRGRPKKMEE